MLFSRKFKETPFSLKRLVCISLAGKKTLEEGNSMLHHKSVIGILSEFKITSSPHTIVTAKSHLTDVREDVKKAKAGKDQGFVDAILFSSEAAFHKNALQQSSLCNPASSLFTEC